MPYGFPFRGSTSTMFPPIFSTKINWPLFILTSGFIILFCGLALVDLGLLSFFIDAGFKYAHQFFGLFWQYELLINFLVSFVICCLPGSKALLGNLEEPEFSTFQWGSMIMCTLLAGGGVFWAACEPLAHFLSPPPLFDVSAGSQAAVPIALAQCYLHWGFLAWAIYGSTTTIVFMVYHYEKDLPLAPRLLLYPLLGDRAIYGIPGLLADAACIISAVAGTVGVIGFIGLQISYGLHHLWGIPDSFFTHVCIISSLVLLYTLSAVSGLRRGVKILSEINVLLVLALLVFMLCAGPTLFILKQFAAGQYTHVSAFFSMALFRDNTGLFGSQVWLSKWTVFFWAWCIGNGPIMAMFIAKISRGRSIRSIIIMLAFVSPLVTNFWFTILGGSGIDFALDQVGTVSQILENSGFPAVLFAITQQFPFGFILSNLFVVLTAIFVATTGDSMTYMISVSLSTNGSVSTIIRVFWGFAMGSMAVVLVAIGSGSIDKLQNFIVITAVPVSLILAPSIWDAIRITHLKAKTL